MNCAAKLRPSRPAPLRRPSSAASVARRAGWLVAASFALAPLAAFADHDVNWDEWYSGQVEVQLRTSRGNGTVIEPGEEVPLSFRVDADAYVAVYAIDTRGDVRLLFPRWWRDEGWVPAGQRVRLLARDLAMPGWCAGDAGPVYVQVLASPVPFDWERAGLVAADSRCTWWSEGRPLRVQGDPLLAFNDVNRLLCGAWEEAVFAADHAWFYVGHESEHPMYLCGVCAGHHRGYHEPWVRVQASFAWQWQRGRRYCRPVYSPMYVYRDDRRALHHARDERLGNRSPSPDGSRERDATGAARRVFGAGHGMERARIARREAAPRETQPAVVPVRPQRDGRHTSGDALGSRPRRPANSKSPDARSADPQSHVERREARTVDRARDGDDRDKREHSQGASERRREKSDKDR